MLVTFGSNFNSPDNLIFRLSFLGSGEDSGSTFSIPFWGEVIKMRANHLLVTFFYFIPIIGERVIRIRFIVLN